MGNLLVYLALILGIIIFLKLGRRIPLMNRILIAVSVTIILILLFIFISAVIALVVVLVIVIGLLAFLNGKVFRFKKIKLKR